jgi:hypothetical protein
MKQFFAFYNSNFDAELQAQTYADEAFVHAKAIGTGISSRIVDVLGNDSSKKFWNAPNTIECVTVDNDTKKDSMLNPSALPDIDGMIDRL